MSILRHSSVLIIIVPLFASTCISQDSALSPGQTLVEGQTLEIGVSVSPSGKVCRLSLVPCRSDLKGERLFPLTRGVWMGHGSGTPSYNDVIERLVPRDERGAYLPDNSDWRIGNCINFRRDEYEKVRITINEDACSPHYMAVTWKELECPLEDPSPVDLCGRAAERSRNALDSFSRRIEFLIARLEKDAAQEDDQAAKQYLLNYAASLRSDLADLPKPSSDLMPCSV